MRIISGEFRGRKLLSPPGLDTRPMLDRVREAAFSTLGGRFDDMSVLDLFAGTGSLGLEAASRGASRVRCVERASGALATLRKNVEALRIRDRVEVVAGDALHPGAWAPPKGAETDWADVVFLDPPYPMLRPGQADRERVVTALRALVEDVLAPGGALVLHAEPRALDAHEFGLEPEPERRVYGRSVLWYVWKAERSEEPS